MKQKRYLVKVTPIATAVILSLPLVVYADMINSNRAAAARTVNNVSVIDINKANENGLSHNIYDKLNVGKEGAIFNNSTNGANTALAGVISGNSNLTSGSAKIILNEVRSGRSNLAGMLEVAGNEAHLIIANPSGITCSGCGFINTNKVTLTSGTPDVQNGVLRGYAVNSGDISVEAQLLNESPTELITRAVTVKGYVGVAKDLTLILGNNYVNTNNQITGSVRAEGFRKSNSLDVAKLGGMYADKITLISTEQGTGVNNSGVIAAGKGGFTLDAQGQLHNKNASIKSNATVLMKLAGDLNNSGGSIASDASVYIDTAKNMLDNSGLGNIQAGKDIAISSGYLNNMNGKMASAGLLAINTNGNTLRNAGTEKTYGLTGGIVALETGFFDNSDGQINGGYIGINSLNTANRNGTIDAIQNIELINNSYNTIDNTGGRIRTVNGHIKIDAKNSTLINNNTKTADVSSSDSRGIIAGDGGIMISSYALENNGQISSNGNIDIKSSYNIDNHYGKISSEKNVNVETKNLVNYASSIGAVGNVSVAASGKLENYVGVLRSDEGTLSINGGLIDNYGGMLLGKDINITATGDVNSNAALVVAVNDINITTKGSLFNNNGNNYGDPYGFYFGMADQKGGIIGKRSVNLTAKNIYSEDSRIIAQAGILDVMTTGLFSNANSQTVGGTAANIKANAINNAYAVIKSYGDVNITASSLDNRSTGNAKNGNLTGVITADKDLVLTMNDSFENTGYLVGKNKVSVTTAKGSLTNRNTISSDNEMNFNVANNLNNYGDIFAGKVININAGGGVYNYSNLFSNGVVNITAQSVNNLLGVIGGVQGLNSSVPVSNILGTVVGK